MMYLCRVSRWDERLEQDIQSPFSLPARNATVKAPSLAKRSIFMILDLSDMPSAALLSSMAAVACGFSSDGKKKGAFSGTLGASVGLLRALIKSRCRSVCHRLFGTILSVIISALNCSIVKLGAESSTSEASSSKAPSITP